MFFDIPKNFQLGFQDPVSPIMTGIIDLNYSIFLYLLFILTGVIYFLIKIISRSITQGENPNTPEQDNTTNTPNEQDKT